MTGCCYNRLRSKDITCPFFLSRGRPRGSLTKAPRNVSIFVKWSLQMSKGHIKIENHCLMEKKCFRIFLIGIKRVKGMDYGMFPFPFWLVVWVTVMHWLCLEVYGGNLLEWHTLSWSLSNEQLFVFGAMWFVKIFLAYWW